MPLIKNTPFICLDCETTGLDPKNDRIVEIAVVKFTTSDIQETFESLVDPEIPISEESLAIHKISTSMLIGKPKIEELLPAIFALIGDFTIIGHGIGFDVDLLVHAASRIGLPCPFKGRPCIDTLRLARHYGDSPNNSLEQLAKHFNVPREGAHRALNDVMMNIGVFKHLTRRFSTTEEIFSLLAQPIKMKYMPLGKHKGRLFSEIPLQYLEWAAGMDFDQDLLFTLRLEIKRRRQGGGFKEAANPFAQL